jgi:hypothetical protein
MELDSLMWISVAKFRKLMGWPTPAIIRACNMGSLIFETVYGPLKKEYRICICSLSVQALKRYLSEKIIEQETESNNNYLEFINTIEYKRMSPSEKNHVKKWYHVLSDTEGLKGKALYQYLKNAHANYNSYRRYFNLYNKTHNFEVLKTNYRNKKKKSSK